MLAPIHKRYNHGSPIRYKIPKKTKLDKTGPLKFFHAFLITFQNVSFLFLTSLFPRLYCKNPKCIANKPSVAFIPVTPKRSLPNFRNILFFEVGYPLVKNTSGSSSVPVVL